MYTASSERYDTMVYNRCGKSGLLLPAVSLGLWHNFGTNADPENMKAMLRTAFDLGITHFDLAEATMDYINTMAASCQSFIQYFLCVLCK